jgi:hypothetical protein
LQQIFPLQVPQEYRPLYNRVWDVSEYVVPPSENEAFFVTTNVIITPNQTLGKCDEVKNSYLIKIQLSLMKYIILIISLYYSLLSLPYIKL